MKKLLLASAAIMALGTASQAQVEFSNGVASIGYGAFIDTDFGIIETSVNAAFNYGDYGFQFGGNIETLTGDAPSFSFSGFDIHAYRKLENGNKIGVFVKNSSSFGPFGFKSIGVEGMFGFGALDVQAGFGYVDSPFGGDSLGQIDLAGYYKVTENIEVNASYNYMFSFDGLFDSASYTIGAVYAFGDSGYSLNASYTSSVDGPGDMVNIGASWNFGPNQDDRLFAVGSDLFSFGA